MDVLPVDLREFLQNQPFLELTEAKKVISCRFLNNISFMISVSRVVLLSDQVYVKWPRVSMQPCRDPELYIWEEIQETVCWRGI